MNFSYINSSNSTLGSIPSRLSTQIGAFFAFFFVIFGLFGNLLIIIAILCKKDLRNNIVNIFIISLQLNDIINICFTQFLVGLSYIYVEWYRNGLICEIFVYTSIICTGALLWHHALISIHRFLVVVRNQTLSYMNMSPKVYAILSLLLARLIPILTLLPALISRNMTTYVGKTLRCMLGNNSVNQNKIIFLINIVVPCLIVVICFVRIFSKVREVSRRISKTTNKYKNSKKSESLVSTNMNTIISTTGCTRTILSTSNGNQLLYSSKKAHNINREIQITKMFGVIFVVFLFGYMPYGLIRSMDKDNSLNADIYILLTILFIVSISISPVIYGLMNTQIKMQCIHLLKIMFCFKTSKYKRNEIRFEKFNKNLIEKEFKKQALSFKTKQTLEPNAKLKSMSKESISISNKQNINKSFLLKLKQKSKSAPDLTLISNEDILLTPTYDLKRNLSAKNSYSALRNYINNQNDNKLRLKSSSNRIKRANERFKILSFKTSFRSFFSILDSEKSVSSIETINKSLKREDFKETDDGGVYKGPEM